MNYLDAAPLPGLTERQRRLVEAALRTTNPVGPTAYADCPRAPRPAAPIPSVQWQPMPMRVSTVECSIRLEGAERSRNCAPEAVLGVRVTDAHGVRAA